MMNGASGTCLTTIFLPNRLFPCSAYSTKSENLLALLPMYSAPPAGLSIQSEQPRAHVHTGKCGADG